MAPQIPGFFKIVLQHNLHSSKLKLPPKFTRKHRGELSDAAQLVVSEGRIWRVGLSREGDHIYLSSGFREFARHYSLSHGHLLVFHYNGMSCFGVAIYDRTTCQISYPKIGEEESDGPPGSGSPANQRSRRPQNIDFEYISRCGVPSPGDFRSGRPHFQAKLKRSDFRYYRVYVPTDVFNSIGEAQRERHLVWLKTGDERRWEVSLVGTTDRGMFLGRMAKFFKAHQLKENDICIFELVKDNLLKVFIFSAI